MVHELAIIEHMFHENRQNPAAIHDYSLVVVHDLLNQWVGMAKVKS